MTEAVEIALIASIPPTIVAVGGVYAIIRQSRKITDLKVHINSRMEELLTVSKDKARLEGKAAGIQEERAK